MEAQHETRMVRVKRVDEAKRIVYAEVYVPNELDTYGEWMNAESVEQMAHNFLKQVQLSASIDVMHNNVATDCYPVESFVAREGDPDYEPGAWVLGVKIVGEDLWQGVLRGDLNGFSFEALVRKRPAVVELVVTPDNFGVTEMADGHQHIFWAEMSDDGRVISGRTTTDAGHSHEIRAGTATEEAAGHAHRFFV